MLYRGFALFLALAIGAVNLVEIVYFAHAFPPLEQRAALVLWGVLPAPALAWLAGRFVQSTWGGWVLCLGFGLVFELSVFLVWGVIDGSGRDEPLNALAVVVVPAYQIVLLLVTLVVAWLVDRRFRASSAPER